jgi:uncharacterized membrane protein YdfJ with MMPL/SSD domain
MSTLMERLAARLRRWRWFVLAVWAALLIAAAPLALRQSEDVVGGGFAVPGSQSEEVRQALVRDFDERAQLALVLAPERSSSPRRRVRAVESLLRAVREVPDVSVPGSTDRRARAAAERGRIAVLPVDVLAAQEREPDVARDVRDRLRAVEGARGSVSSHVIGRGAVDAAIQDEAQEQLKRADAIGFPFVLLILLAIFGSLAAAALPVLLGVAAVLLSGAAIFLASQEFLISSYATNTASIFGIALAVDYSMFILVRFREEVRAGRDRDSAIAKALSTSGVAIIFSGLALLVATAGLFIIDNAGLRSMASIVLFAVSVSMLLSTVLLPVLLKLFGKRLVRQGRLAWGSRRRGDPMAASQAFWQRWTRVVLGRPVLFAVAAIALLLALGAPTLSLNPGEYLIRQLPTDNDTRVAYARAAAAQGPGAASPVQVVLRSERSRPVDRRTVASVRRTMARDPAIATVEPPEAGAGGRSVLLTAIPRADGSAEPTEELVRRLRSELTTGPVAPGVTANVGGVTAYSIDFQNQIFDGLWKVAAFGLAFSFILLIVLLRSLILPIKAMILNILTVVAAYGVLVIVFQWGWLDGFLGFESKDSVDVFSMPLIMVTVFGLSMDYEIFLLSRIRERYERHGDSNTAIAEGLASSARPITGAALIMVSLFCVFATTSLTAVKELGLGLAVAIALDATIVRLVLVPATMRLFGEWNWWLPRPLAGLVDRIDVAEESAR